MTKQDKQDLNIDVKESYTPTRRVDKKYKGDLVYRNEKGELKYW